MGSPRGNLRASKPRGYSLSVYASTYSAFLQGHFLRELARCCGPELHRPYHRTFNDCVIEKEQSRQKIEYA